MNNFIIDEENENSRIDYFLSTNTDYSRSKINKMINRNEDELFIKYYNRILKIYNNNK